MNYRGVITDDELDALRARNACRRGEAVRAMGAAHTLHPSHAPTRQAHVQRCLRIVAESLAKIPLTIVTRAAWADTAGSRRP